jgi:hypothetical protein
VGLAPRFILAALVAATAMSEVAAAAPSSFERTRARMLAQNGRCAEAIPLLEKLEEEDHRPGTADPLAKCYEKNGELLRASDLFHRIEGDTRTPYWDFYDVSAAQRAKQNAARVDALIATLRVAPEEAYEGLEITVDGNRVSADELRFDPPATVEVKATAPGRRPFARTVELAAGAREVIALRLEKARAAEEPTKKRRRPRKKAAAEDDSELWLGARFEGIIIPRFLMNAFGEGGRDVFVPGGALTFTVETASPELVFAIAYASYGLGDTPFKESGTADTEWEIIESDLMSLAATMDIMWAIPFDRAEHAAFRIGLSLGVGVTFFGDLYRTQAYPEDFEPGDPYEYKKCKGPNEPAGSFRYCNELDKDADHYDGYAEPSWFAGGSRPLVYPWGAAKIGFTFKPTDEVAIDVEGGYGVSGFVTGLGLRFGL